MNHIDDHIASLLRKGPPEEDFHTSPPFTPPMMSRAQINGPPKPAATKTMWAGAAAFLAIVVTMSIVIIGRLPISPASKSHGSATATVSTEPPTASARWPITLPPEYGGGVAAISSDGITFAASESNVISLDSAGAIRPGWPASSPVTSPILELIPTNDGGVIAASDSQLTALDPSGRVRPGWPVAINGSAVDGVFLTPDRRILVISSIDNETSQILMLTLSGGTASGWPQTIVGRVTGRPTFGSGRIALAFVSSVGSGRVDRQVVVWDDSGIEQPGSPFADWDGVNLTQSGDIVVWSYETASSRSAGLSVIKTRLAIIGANGRTNPGWPKQIYGPASVPAIAADGSVYLALGDGQVGSRGSVTAFDPSGRIKSGWPTDLPMETMPLAATSQPQGLRTSVAPIVGPDEVIFIQAASASKALVAAYDPNGRMVEGWPYVVPSGQRFSDLMVGIPNGPATGLIVGPTGNAFALLTDESRDLVTAIDPDGSIVPGWPAVAPDGLAIANWSVLADGALEMVGTSSTPATLILRYTSSGIIAP